MRNARWLLYVWPGLPQLWWRGAWSALVVAVGFGLALDVAVLATWVWAELLAASLRPFAWPALGLVWIAGMAATAWRGSCAAAAADISQREDLFPRTLGEYLRGNWLEAEILCRRLLERGPRDAEALLLLATVLRHAGRTDEAQATLLQLRRLDAAATWEQEIGDELARLAETNQGVVQTHENVEQPESETVREDRHDEPRLPDAVTSTGNAAPSRTMATAAEPKLMDAA